MQEFDRLDHGSFRAFMAAAQTLNFTLAAEKAAMTQSGVSQHIARLEDQLGAQLFKRVNKKVFLTKSGEILRDYIEKQQDEMSVLFEKIQGEAGELTGSVRYAMPHSCLFTPHFPLLLKKRRNFSKVNLDVQLIPNDEIFAKLLDQEVDFGFVTKRTNNQAVRHELFAVEEYVLVGKDKRQFKDLSKDNIADLPFVSYPGMNILFDMWAENHFRTKNITHECLSIAGAINSLHGAITMVRHGVGFTVLPRHCALDLLDEKLIFDYPGAGKALTNEIYIVTLESVEYPRRVRAVMDAFWEMKKHQS